MRIWQATLGLLASAAAAAPAAAEEVYVPIGYTDNMIVLVQTTAELRERRNLRRATQFTYYAMPSFDFAGVPVRMTETEFEIDCAARATRRLAAKAYRDIGDRVGNETYSEAWSVIPAGDHMATMHRLACVGVGDNDITFSSLRSAVTGSLPLLQTAAAG